MPRHPMPRLAPLLLGLLCGCAAHTNNPPLEPAAAPGEQAQEEGVVRTHFRVSYSEKLDAAVFLNAISTEPIFNGPWEEPGTAWRQQISEDPLVNAAFQRWQARGIQLAYLLSAIPENDLARTVERFQAPTALVEDLQAGLDEPAYSNVLDDFTAQTSDLQVLLGFLETHGFSEMRLQGYGDRLAETRTQLEPLLDELEATPLQDWLETLTGRQVEGNFLDIYVLVFSWPYSFQLSGWAIGWAYDRGDPAWLLTHEFMHKYNPSAEVLALQARLAQEDPFYGEAYARIHDRFHEGKEEAMVEAASLYALRQLGLMSETRILRSLKLRYYDQVTGLGGMPLAVVLYDELVRAAVQPGPFSYNDFIVGLFESGAIRAGTMESRFRAIIAPVSGMAGMSLQERGEHLVVMQVFDGFPAAEAGLMVEDRLLAINGTSMDGLGLEDGLDLLAGPAGTPIQLQVERAGETLQVDLQLK